MIKTLLVKLPLIFLAFFLCLLVLPLLPGIDLWMSGLFYDARQHIFPWHGAFPVRQIYDFFAFIDAPLLLLLIALLAWAYFKHWPGYRKRLLGFLLVSLVIGPGLLTNTVLKDNSIGRARPVQVVEFGGEKPFTPALVYSGACEQNCSFVSGHAALGFYCMVLGWIFRSRRAFYIGLGIGAIVGFGRVMQGGHFFSDVIFAFWLVLFTLMAVSYLFKLTPPVNLWYSAQDRIKAKKTI